MTTDADTVVPFGPITSKGRVKVVVVAGLFGLVFNSMVAVAVLLGWATLVAVSITVCAVLIGLGAV
jgi:hypothetical protein